MQMDRKSELLLRVYVVFFAFVLFAGIIMFKVIKIALFEGDKWREQGGRYVKWVDVEGDRGNIYDVHGNLLALFESCSACFIHISHCVTSFLIRD